MGNGIPSFQLDAHKLLTTTFKPSTHSTTFVAGNRDLVFCRQRRKRTSSIFDIEERRQRQKSFIYVSSTQQVFVGNDKNLRSQQQKSCCVRSALGTPHYLQYGTEEKQ